MNGKIKLTLLMLSIAALIITGCGSSKTEPVAVNEDIDKCAICNMQVHDDAFATQLITEEGKVYKFDDLGCMNDWKIKNTNEAIAIEFVRDSETSEWVKLDNAYFAYDPSFQSPMAYGIVSFKDKSSAEQYIAHEGTGTLLSAADLAGHSWERGSMHMDDHHHEHAHGEEHTKGTH